VGDEYEYYARAALKIRKPLNEEMPNAGYSALHIRMK